MKQNSLELVKMRFNIEKLEHYFSLMTGLTPLQATYLLVKLSCLESKNCPELPCNITYCKWVYPALKLEDRQEIPK